MVSFDYLIGMSLAPGTPPAPEDRSRWSDRIRTLSLDWRSSPTAEQRSRIVSELWVLVNTALARYVRLHSRSYGHVDPEDVRDIASEKTVAFLRNLESGTRDLGELQSSQMCSYLSVLARNGLVDALRKASRNGARELHDDGNLGTPVAPESDGAEVTLRHQEFLRAICNCVATLSPRAQTAWFFRAFLDMPSKAIAAHPDIGMTSTAVDMLLSRTRRSLAECMESKGFNSDDAPPGTFVALWELLNGGETRLEGGESDAATSDR